MVRYLYYPAPQWCLWSLQSQWPARSIGQRCRLGRNRTDHCFKGGLLPSWIKYRSFSIRWNETEWFSKKAWLEKEEAGFLWLQSRHHSPKTTTPKKKHIELWETGKVNTLRAASLLGWRKLFFYSMARNKVIQQQSLIRKQRSWVFITTE